MSGLASVLTQLKTNALRQISVMMNTWGVENPYASDGSNAVMVTRGKSPIVLLRNGRKMAAMTEDYVFDDKSNKYDIEELFDGEFCKELESLLSLLDHMDRTCREDEAYAEKLVFRLGEELSFNDIEGRLFNVREAFGQDAVDVNRYGNNHVGEDIITVNLVRLDVTYLMVMVGHSDQTGDIYRVVNVE